MRRLLSVLAWSSALAVLAGCSATEDEPLAPTEVTTTDSPTTSVAATATSPALIQPGATATTIAPPRDPNEPGYPTTAPRPTPSYPGAGR